jgi:hypothetical protein
MYWRYIHNIPCDSKLRETQFTCISGDRTFEDTKGIIKKWYIEGGQTIQWPKEGGQTIQWLASLVTVLYTELQ